MVRGVVAVVSVVVVHIMMAILSRKNFVVVVHGFQPIITTTTTTTTIGRSSSSKTKLYLFDLFNEGKKALVKQIAGEYDSTQIQQRMNTLIRENNVLMLSFTTCPYCIKAKSILDSKNTKYTVLELDQDKDGKAMRAEMANLIGRTSVPAIWIDGIFIGGCNDGPSTEYCGVVKLDEQGKLNTMLQKANAI